MWTRQLVNSRTHDIFEVLRSKQCDNWSLDEFKPMTECYQNKTEAIHGSSSQAREVSAPNGLRPKVYATPIAIYRGLWRQTLAAVLLRQVLFFISGLLGLRIQGVEDMILGAA